MFYFPHSNFYIVAISKNSMKLKNCFILIAVFVFILLLTQFSSATISMKTEFKPVYNIGDRINASVEILKEEDVQGILKTKLKCPGYELEYFTTIIEIKKAETKTIILPELPVKKLMIGECYLIIIVENMNGQLIYTFESEKFNVSDKLDGAMIKSKDTIIPGESLILYVDLNPTYRSESTKYFSANILSEVYKYETNLEQFNYTINTKENIKSGEKNIAVYVLDSYGNNYEKEIEFSVTAVPTRLGLNISSNAANPGDNLVINPYLYDQADDILNEEVVLSIFEMKNTLLKKEVMSGQAFTYQVPQFTPPGNYNVKIIYNNLNEAEKFSVNEFKKINVDLQKGVLVVENVGNVPYYQDLVVDMDGENNYNLTYEINLRPAEKKEIELSKFVRTGNYSFSVYEKQNISNVNINTNLSLQDDRPTYRKISQGLLSITGNSIIAYQPTKKVYSIAILITIVFLVIVVAGRMKSIKPKDKTKKEIDEEFKY